MGLSFTVKKPVQRFSSPAGCVWIQLLVDLGHRIEQAPGCPWQELTVTGFTPLTKHVWNLRRGDRTSIQGSDHNVVRSLIIDPCFIVREDPLVKILEFTSELTNGSRSQMTEIPLSIACVFPCDLYFAAEAQIVTAEYFGACYQTRWEGLVVAVPYSYAPSPFEDSPAGQVDVQNAKVALSVVTQSMSFFGDDKARASELIMDFTEHPAVR